VAERRHRAAAIAAVVLVFLLAMLFAPERRDVLDLRPSSFLSTPGGAKALFLTLEELGVPVERRVAPLTRDPTAGPLALLAPTLPPSDAELEVLATWVEAGGTLLYAGKPDDRVLPALGIPAPVHMGAERSAVPPVTAAHPWLHELAEVHGFRYAFRDSAGAPPAEAEPLLVTADGDVVAGVWRRGEGRVVAWADPAPLLNRALRESGAALLFARTAAEAATPEAPLAFDEYHHGFRGDGHPVRATLRFLAETRPGHAALQLLAMGLGALVLAGTRFGAPMPTPAPRRRSPLEHVDALAELYRRAGARGNARRLLLAQLARRLGRRPPQSTGDEEHTLEKLLAGLPADRAWTDAVREAWRRDDLVALATAIDRLVIEVKRT
jgi:hypothetical protein